MSDDQQKQSGSMSPKSLPRRQSEVKPVLLFLGAWAVAVFATIGVVALVVPWWSESSNWPTGDEPLSQTQVLLNPWFWGPADNEPASVFLWPDYRQDVRRWTCFALFVVFLLCWAAWIQRT